MLRILKVTSYIKCEIIEGLTTKEMVKSLIDSGKNSILFHSITDQQLDKIYQSSLDNNKINTMNLITSYRKPVLGYNLKVGLIKISDPLIPGKFTIKDNQIIYDSNISKLTEERDYDKYVSPVEYYTTESLENILRDYIYDGRQCLVDKGINYSNITFPMQRIIESYIPDDFYIRCVGRSNSNVIKS